MCMLLMSWVLLLAIACIMLHVVELYLIVIFFLGMQFLLGPVQKETKKLYSFNCISGIPFCKHTSVLEKRMI